MGNSVSASFEFFPPRDAEAGRRLAVAVRQLAKLKPRFISVTYGADGSPRNRTRECVLRMVRETGLCVAPHLTCVGASADSVLDTARDYWHQGMRRIVALRGDLPAAAAPAGPPRSFRHADELVRGIASIGGFEIAVAAYPEGHPENPGVAADVQNLKRKIDAGAHHAITQFFFDTDAFLRYRDLCAASGICADIVPGILPIQCFAQMMRFAGRCGALIPAWVGARFERADAAAARSIAIEIGIEQVLRLRAQGVAEFHFYTLNNADLTRPICDALGMSEDGSGESGDAPDRSHGASGSRPWSTISGGCR